MWHSKRQNYAALSSSESEYVAMSTACRDLAALRAMCENLLLRNITTPKVFEDNKSAIKQAQKDDVSSLRHLEKLSYHFVREEHKCGNIEVLWVVTNNQIGLVTWLCDFITKSPTTC